MHAASVITFLGPLSISHLVKRNLIRVFYSALVFFPLF